MARLSIRRNKNNNWMLSTALVMLFVAIALDNYFFYPSYFNLMYVSDGLAEFVILHLPGDPMEWLEHANKYIAISMFIFFLLGSFVVGLKTRKKIPYLIWLGILLFIYYMAEWQDHGFQLAFLAEIALQAFAIWVVVLGLKQRNIYLLVLSALTFAGHGLYALNIYPRPGYFVDMMISAFPFDEGQSIVFLQFIGVVDLLCLVLVAYKPTQKSVLMYMVFWGLLTALARPVYNFSSVFWQESLIIWIPEFLKRGVHFLIPLYLLLERRLPAWGK